MVGGWGGGGGASSSVEEQFCLTLLEIYDAGEVFTEVRAAHFTNQLVKQFAYLKRGFSSIITHHPPRPKKKEKKILMVETREKT